MGIQRYCTLDELKEKDVINTENGKNYGCISDIEIDLLLGKIVTLIIPAKENFFKLGTSEVYKVCWEDIERIGEDAILIKCSPPLINTNKKK